VPLIEYTLEFLAMNGVQHVYIYCGAHAEQVESYVESSRWSNSSGVSHFLSLQFIPLSGANSIGDFLRDLDKRSLMVGDFIVVNGDLVSNIKLDLPLAAHRARREASSENIMTSLLINGGLGPHRTKANGITPVFVVDSKTKRCLHYDEIHPFQSDHYVTLDPAVFGELSEEYEIRADLIDPGIDICTPEVLLLWSESFDYELPRRNFLHGVIKDWELNGKAIYADILAEGYGARASNLQMYESISRDVLGRWAYPFTPDINLFPGSNYALRRRRNLTTESPVDISAEAKFYGTTVGRGTSIGPNSRITKSIIGRNCKIGKDVTIEDSYIWEGATVQDGSKVTRSIVANSAIIGKNCSIPAGSLISFGVHIGDNISFSKVLVLSTMARDSSAVKPDTELLGPSTNAAPYIDPDADDEDEEDPATLQKSLIYSTAHLNLSTSTVSTLASESDLETDEEADETPSRLTSTDIRRTRNDSFASDDSSAIGGGASFHKDAVRGLLAALRDESEDFDAAKLEFMGLRLGSDASDVDMRRAVAAAFARRAAELLAPEKGGLEPTKAAEQTFNRKGAAKFVSEVGVGGEEAEQVEFALAVQKALVAVKGLETAKAGVLLSALMQKMYGLDILEEEGILKWWDDQRAQGGEGMRTVREKCRVLVEWLATAEEDDDGSGDESEDEE
jgi:translation initiation factor eIF-2B subunit epsilon